MSTMEKFMEGWLIDDLDMILRGHEEGQWTS